MCIGKQAYLICGPGGVTSLTISWTPPPANWRPDLVKSKDRIIFAAIPVYNLKRIIPIGEYLWFKFLTMEYSH